MNREVKELRKNNPTASKLFDTINKPIGEICKLFRNGSELEEICNELHLSKQLVESIIIKLDLRKRYRN